MKIDTRSALDDEVFGQGVDIGVAQRELRLLGNIGRALRRSFPWIVLGSLVGGGLGYALSYLSEVRYTSVAQVMIDTRESAETDFGPVVSGLPTSLTSLESELEVLRSVDLVERVVDRFELYNDAEFYSPPDDEPPPELPDALNLRRETTIANVAGRTAVEQAGNISAVYAIRFTSEDPAKAATLANALAEEYLATTRIAKLRSLELSQGWLAERTNELQVRLTELGVQLERHLLGAPYSPDEIETTKARSISAERRVKQVEAEIASLADLVGNMQAREAAGDLLGAAGLVREPSAALAEAQLAATNGVEGAETALAAALEREYERIAIRRERLQGEVAPLRAEAASTLAILVEQAERDAETRRIENDITVSEAIYQDFVSQLSRRTEQNEYLDADARVISTARPPLTASEPQRRLSAGLGLVLAALLLATGVIVREIFQRRMRNIVEFETGTGLPLVGVTPEMPAAQAPMKTFFDTGAISPALMRFARKLRLSILADLPDDPANFAADGWSEAEWTGSRSTGGARAGLTRVSGQRAGGTGAGSTPPRMVIAGASCSPDDGQSSAILALGCAFADAGERVLLIDADFSGSRYAPLAAPEVSALDHILTDPRRAKGFVIESSWPRLSILPAPADAEQAAQQIGLAEWRRLLRHLSSQYDRILIDTAPLISKIDTAVLHQAADAVVLFARWNSTSSGEIRSILKVLGDVGVTPVSVVATRIRLDRVRRYGDDALFYLGRSMAA